MKIEVILGDITQETTDAIVNAANSGLLGGGGVDGAIHRAAGSDLLKECAEIAASNGSCAPGNAVITKGYKLKARYVIHAVGPVWRGGRTGERETLVNCYKNALRLASERALKSISFPNISTGAYGFPKAEAARLVADFFGAAGAEYADVELVRFVCFDRENYELYQVMQKTAAPLFA
jgi:O-acetyl-ADP-ribose deacetylase (regulator of RNase III)